MKVLLELVRGLLDRSLIWLIRHQPVALWSDHRARVCHVSGNDQGPAIGFLHGPQNLLRLSKCHRHSHSASRPSTSAARWSMRPKDGARWVIIFPNADGCRSLSTQLMRASFACRQVAGLGWFAASLQRSGFPSPPSGACDPAQDWPSPVGPPETRLLPRIVNLWRSHAREVEALSIELQVRPHGPGRFLERGHSRRGACPRRR